MSVVSPCTHSLMVGTSSRRSIHMNSSPHLSSMLVFRPSRHLLTMPNTFVFLIFFLPSDLSHSLCTYVYVWECVERIYHYYFRHHRYCRRYSHGSSLFCLVFRWSCRNNESCYCVYIFIAELNNGAPMVSLLSPSTRFARFYFGSHSTIPKIQANVHSSGCRFLRGFATTHRSGFHPMNFDQIGSDFRLLVSVIV